MLHGTVPARQVSEQIRKRTAPDAVNLADSGKRLVEALDSGSPDIAERAMQEWWKVNTRITATSGEWRSPLLEDCLLVELDGDLMLHRLAERANVHPFHLSRLSKKETGYTYTNYVLRHRMIRAKQWLDSGMKYTKRRR